MAVEIGVLLDIHEAEQAANKLQGDITKALALATGKGEEEFKNLSKRAVDEFKKISQAAQETAEETEKVGGSAEKSLKKILTIERVDQARDAFGNLKDIFEKTGTSLLGLEKETTESIVAVADLTEKGAAAGAVFGPLGAIIGGAVATGIGIFNERAKEAAKAEAEAAAKAKSLNEDLGDLLDQLNSFSGVSLGSLITELDGVKTKFEEVKGSSVDAIVAQARWLVISGKSADAVKEAIGVALEASNPNRTIKSLREASAELSDLQSQLETIQTELNDKSLDPSALAEKSKTAATLIGDLQRAKADYDLSLSTETKHIADAQQAAKEQAQAAAKFAQETKKAGDAASKAVNEAFGPFAAILGKVADNSDEASAAFATMEISINGAAGALAGPGVERFADGLGVITESIRTVNPEMDALIEKAGQLGLAFGGVAADGLDLWFNALQDGDKKAGKAGKGFEQMLVRFLRAEGKMLLGAGIADTLRGQAMIFTGDPVLGGGLFLTGLAELAAGAAMEVGGAALGRHAGIKSGGASAGSSGGSVGGGSGRPISGVDSASGPKTQAPSNIVLNVQTLTPGDQRSWEMAGAAVARALDSHVARGGRLPTN